MLENWFRGSGCIAKGSVRVYLGLCVRLKYPVWPVSACYCYPTNCFSVSHLPSSHHLTPSFYLSCLSCSSFPSHLPLSLITHHSSIIAHYTYFNTVFLFLFLCYMLASFLLFILGRTGAGEPAEGNHTGKSGLADGGVGECKGKSLSFKGWLIYIVCSAFPWGCWLFALSSSLPSVSRLQ